jgi:hypothetical protein
MAYFSNSTKSWYPDEDGALWRAHKYGKASVLDLAYKHKRTPDRIIQRLLRLKKIKTPEQANGYTEYRTSHLSYVLEPPRVTTATTTATKSLETIDETDEQEDYSSTEMPWSIKEIIQLKELYTVKNLPLMEIAKLHNRAPHAVIEQLKTQKLVKTLTSITGYAEYKQTPLYITHAKEERQKQKEAKEKALEDSKYNVSFMKQDIHDLKNEVAALNNTVADLQIGFNDLLNFVRTVFAYGACGAPRIMQKAFAAVHEKNSHPIQGRKSWR